ncbi:MAG: T9SS type A sorting domain-containing protein [Candidatus Fermentibacteria bacterium]|nr:T9SS type A sorting domain-containing protein [Candidatus Fermentibacteria bacterium]
MLTILAFAISLLQNTAITDGSIHRFPDIPIGVVDTWLIPYAADIQDVSFNWNSNTLILRSNGEGKIFLADPYSCDSVGEIDLPPGSDGFGVAISPSYSEEYYINTNTSSVILHSDGSGSWSELSNPAGARGAGLDFNTIFSCDLLLEASNTTPCGFYCIETDGSGHNSYSLPEVNGEISGFMGHEVMTESGYPPSALILTTRLGHEFFFFYKSGESYTLYGQEPCPLPVSESLGLTWSPDGYVYWSHKGLDQEFYVSLLAIPVFGAIAGENNSMLNTDALSLTENPSAGSAVLTVDLPTPELISLEIYDISGRLVEVLHSGELDSGRNTFSFSGSPGVYIIVLSKPHDQERLRFALTG